MAAVVALKVTASPLRSTLVRSIGILWYCNGRVWCWNANGSLSVRRWPLGVSLAGTGEEGTSERGKEEDDEDVFMDSSASSGCSSMDLEEPIPLVTVSGLARPCAAAEIKSKSWQSVGKPSTLSELLASIKAGMILGQVTILQMWSQKK